MWLGGAGARGLIIARVESRVIERDGARVSPGVSIATHRRGNRVNNATTDRDTEPAPGQRCVYDYSVARHREAESA